MARSELSQGLARTILSGMTNNDSQVWFITGSSRGLGRALVEAVLDAGHRVMATARKPSDLEEVVRKHGGRAKAIALDVTSPEQAAHAVGEAVDAFGRIDVLVNDAGYANTCSAEDIPLDDFRRQISWRTTTRIARSAPAPPPTGRPTSQTPTPGGRSSPPHAEAGWRPCSVAHGEGRPPLGVSLLSP